MCSPTSLRRLVGPPFALAPRRDLGDLGTVKVGLLALAVPFIGACPAPSNTTTFVVLENDYPASSGRVIYRAFWQAVPFQAPLPPGSSSDPQITVPASANTAYVVIAPGWDPSSATQPTSFIVLESRQGYGVDVSNTVHIPVSDAAFAGDCAAGSALPQAEADFLTQIVFPDVFGAYEYDAATCSTIARGEAGAR
jgi:hypothetical protein